LRYIIINPAVQKNTAKIGLFDTYWAGGVAEKIDVSTPDVILMTLLQKSHSRIGLFHMPNRALLYIQGWP